MKRNRLFSMQAVLMLLSAILAITILSRIFALAKKQSREAELLNKAVRLAANGAEVFLAEKDELSVYRVLNENDNAILALEVIALYDEELNPDQNGDLVLAIAISEDGDLYEALIKVYYYDRELYSLKTAVRGDRDD